MSTKPDITVIATNKKAHYQYFIVNKYKTGIVLKGTEVKSVRAGKVSLSDSYCYFLHGELWIKNMHIAEYNRAANFTNHAPKSARKLLMQKRELRRLEAKMKEKGLTMVPIEVFINERDFVKVEIALVKGKRFFDKRNTIKDRDMNRDMQRNLKY